jgi:erythromycin esterase-like protein
VITLKPAHPSSYERVFHDSARPAYLLPLRHPARPEVAEELAQPRLERAIGVVYRPDSELQSHYFQAALARQFDEYVWFDETQPIRAISSSRARALPSIHPFAWR